jgi:hypothetical protein
MEGDVLKMSAKKLPTGTLFIDGNRIDVYNSLKNFSGFPPGNYPVFGSIRPGKIARPNQSIYRNK